MMSKIWINLTTIVNFFPKKVGITRVETELYFELYRTNFNKGCNFCYWDGKRFLDVTDLISNVTCESSSKWLSDVVARVKGKASQNASNTPSSEKNVKHSDYLFTAVDKKTAIKYFCTAIFSFCPDQAKFLLDRIFRYGQGRVYHPFIRTLENIRQRKAISERNLKANKTPLQHSDNSIFSEGDCFFTGGVDWEFNWLTTLENAFDKGLRIFYFCHDLVPVRYPQYCLPHVVEKFPEHVIRQFLISEAIFTNSECCKKDIQRFLYEIGSAQKVIEVIPMGVKKFGTQLVHYEDIRLSERLSEKFVLLVSTIERRKNHAVLYAAAKKMYEMFGKECVPQFVFVGKKGWGVNDNLRDMQLDPEIKSCFLFLNDISDEELFYLYRQCQFLLVPSFFEGWGLPVSEALSLGKFVICSDVPALREAGGEFCDYIDPYSPIDWARSIHKYFSDEVALLDKEQRILQKYNVVTWQKAARTFSERLLAQINLQE